MTRIYTITAAVAAISLSACADSSSSTAKKTAHADARLGSHVPSSYNAAPSQDEVNPALAGEKAFPNSAAGGSNNAGGAR